MSPRIYVYIDGFNLYYGSLRKSPHKWLDVLALCRLILKHGSIDHIRYFTALVQNRPEDPSQTSRQLAYLRALRTLPNLSVELGHFLTNDRRMRLANACCHFPGTVMVQRTEEKGSDVNLAVRLVEDGYEDRFDEAWVVSNDSDLSTAIQIVKARLGKKIGVMNPHKHPCKEFVKLELPMKRIRSGALQASQLPERLTDENGEIRKPDDW